MDHQVEDDDAGHQCSENVHGYKDEGEQIFGTTAFVNFDISSNLMHNIRLRDEKILIVWVGVYWFELVQTLLSSREVGEPQDTDDEHANSKLQDWKDDGHLDEVVGVLFVFLEVNNREELVVVGLRDVLQFPHLLW